MQEFFSNNEEYILGALTAIVIPFAIWIKNKLRGVIKRYQFKKMIFSEYVEPAEADLQKCKTTGDFHQQSQKYGKSITRLDYLKTEEIKHLNDGNQFYYIRSIEFTKSLFKLLSDEAGKYEFKQPFPSQENLKREKEYNKNKKRNMEEIVEKYRKNYQKYANLEIDKLM